MNSLIKCALQYFVRWRIYNELKIEFKNSDFKLILKLFSKNWKKKFKKLQNVFLQ